jgi:hypothetical protein
MMKRAALLLLLLASSPTVVHAEHLYLRCQMWLKSWQSQGQVINFPPRKDPAVDLVYDIDLASMTAVYEGNTPKTPMIVVVTAREYMITDKVPAESDGEFTIVLNIDRVSGEAKSTTAFFEPAQPPSMSDEIGSCTKVAPFSGPRKF